MASPLDKMNTSADELARLDYSDQNAKGKIHEKLEGIEKELGQVTPASKKTLEKLQSAAKILYDKSKDDATQMGGKIKALAGRVLQDVAAKSTSGVSLSPKAAAQQAAAFEASRRANFRLTPQGQALLEESAKIKKQIVRLENQLTQEQTKLQEVLATRNGDDESALREASQQEKVKNLNKEIAKAKEKLAKLDSDVEKGMVMPQTDTKSVNVVSLDPARAVAVKVQTGADEAAVRRTCDALGLSDTIASSKVGLFPGKIKPLQGNEVVRPEVVVQPFVTNAKLVKDFTLKEMNSNLVPLLHVTDTERKMVAQLMLEATDLHTSNGFVQLTPNSDFEALAAKKWEYRDPVQNRWVAITLEELAWGIAQGRISQSVSIRESGDVLGGVALQSHAGLQKALKGSFQFVFIDNERVLGKGGQLQTGDPNAFALVGRQHCLPIRCFFLGTKLAMRPLTATTASLLEDLQTKKEQVKQAHGAENWLLFNRLSDGLKADLEKFFFSDKFRFARVADVQAAKGEGLFLAQFPPELRAKVAKEIREKKLIAGFDAPIAVPQDVTEAFTNLAQLAAELDPLVTKKGYSTQALIASLQRAIDPKSPDFNRFGYLDDCLELVAAAMADPKIRPEDMPQIVKVQTELLKITEEIRHFARTALQGVTEKLNKALLGLCPRVDPTHTKAQFDRLEIGRKYIIAMRQGEKSWQDNKKLLQPVDVANWKPAHAAALNAQIDAIELFLQSSELLPPKQRIQRRNEVAQLKALLTQEAQTGKMTADTKKHLDTYLKMVDVLVRPTIYGLTRALYPQYYFIVDLLQDIYEKSQTAQRLLQVPVAEYREDFLFRGTAINLSFQQVANGHPVETSCELIIREAVQRGIIANNDPRVVAARKEMAAIKARGGYNSPL